MYSNSFQIIVWIFALTYEVLMVHHLQVPMEQCNLRAGADPQPMNASNWTIDVSDVRIIALFFYALIGVTDSIV